MGLFDKKPDTDQDADQPRADFSNVQGGSSSTAPRPRAEVEVRSYTVIAGDSLSKIAKREYGDAQKWRQIYEANRDQIKDPDLIYPGQVLTIPAEK
jgi:nucleoid-associated protein YgaU